MSPNRAADPFARWSGTGAVALSSGEGTGAPVRHRLDFRGNRRVNSMLYTVSVTQARVLPEAAVYLTRKNYRRQDSEKLDEPTNGISPTGPSVACGKTNNIETNKPHSPLDKEACNTARPTGPPPKPIRDCGLASARPRSESLTTIQHRLDQTRIHTRIRRKQPE